MRTLHSIVFLALLFTGIAACRQEENPALEEDRETYTFSLAIPEQETKGLIGTWNDRSAETRITQARLAIYQNGQLLSDYTPGSNVKVQLNKGLVYNIYAITSTGEGWEWPQDEMELADKPLILDADPAVYRARGIPQFGSRQAMRPESADAEDGFADGNITIHVRRLFARVTFRFEPAFEDTQPFVFDDVLNIEVRNANRVLRPFAGTCKALSSSDILSAADRQTETFTYTLGNNPIILYVPENAQGDLLPGNTSPYQKTPSEIDRLNGSGKADLCTYLQATVHSDEVYLPGVGGDAIYRFFLGKDNCRNFDVEGNVDYDVTLTLTKDGLGLTGNWKVNPDGLYDSRHFHFLSYNRPVRPGGTAYVRCNYGSDDTYDDFASPLWGARWGFYAGNAATFASYTAAGDTDAGQVHLHGTSLVCPHCGYVYEAFPDGLNGDSARYGTATIQERQHQWIAYNLFRDGEHYYCRYCSDHPHKFFTTADLGSLPLVAVASYPYTGPGSGTYLWITVPDTVPLHSIYPIFGGSGDGKITDRLDLQVGDDTPVLLDLSTLPSHIAQQGTVTASRLPAGTTGLTFRLVQESVSGVLDVEDVSGGPDNVACLIKTHRAGSATLKVYDKETNLEAGTFIVNVAPPLIRFEGNTGDTHWLIPDGTAHAMAAHYETSGGEAMSVAATDAEGYGTKFAPSLYASNLGDIATTAGSHADTPLLGFSGNQVYLQFFEHSGRTVTFNTVLPDAVRLMSPFCPDVLPVNLNLAVSKPVTGYLGDNILIDDWSLLAEIGWDATQTASKAWRARPGSTILLPGQHLSIGSSDITTPVAAENMSVSLANVGLVNGMVNGTPYYDNIESEVSSGGQVTVKVSPGGYSKGVGQFDISFYVKNFRNNQYYATKIGSIKIYLHTVIGGWLEIPGITSYIQGNSGFGVSTEIYIYPLGYWKIPEAFNIMLEDCMDLDSEIYDLLNGAPSYIQIKGRMFTVEYTWAGQVNWRPDRGVYEQEMSFEISGAGPLHIYYEEYKKGIYDYHWPRIGVVNAKVEATGHQEYLKQYPNNSNTWYYAIGGMRDADNGNRGYYVFQFLRDFEPASNGWYDRDKFVLDPPGGRTRP